MKRRQTVVFVIVTGIIAALAVQGCGNTSGQFDEAAIRRIAREEAKKEREEYEKSFAPEKFGFGGALEKEWAHAQAVKTGNFIFVSGQQPYDTNLDEKGMPLTDKETGQPFEAQLTTVLENIQKCLDHYGATMDDVVFLQAFVDERAGKNKAEFNNAAQVITRFFPKAQQSMTFVSVENLFGPEQLIEANAIAVIHK